MNPDARGALCAKTGSDTIDPVSRGLRCLSGSMAAVAFLCVFAESALAAGTGSLGVRIVGLPPQQAAHGVLRGPDGLKRTVSTAALTVARARVGTYRLTLRSVKITRGTGPIHKGAIAEPLRRTISVRVISGRRVSLVGTYGSIINPGIETLSGGAVSLTGPAGNPTAIVLSGHRVFAPGAILSIPPSALLPDGVLSHVLAVTYRGGDTTASLSAASIYEVAPSFQFDVPLTESQASAAAVSVACGGASGVSPYRRIEDISFSGGWNKLRYLHLPIGVRAAVHFTAVGGLMVTEGLELGCTLQASVSANGMAGPIPVTAAIQGELSAFAGAGGILESGGSVHVDAGASTIGAPPVLAWVPEVSFSSPRFTLTAHTFAQATAEIGVAVKLGVGNSYAASATLNFGSSMDFSAQPGACTWDARFGQFSAEGSLLGWHIETLKTPALFTKELWHSACGSSGSGSGGGSSGGSGGGSGRSVGSTAVSSLSASELSTCAVLTTGVAECWGANSDGQLGDGTQDEKPTPVPVDQTSHAVAISAGSDEACDVLTTGRITCWGASAYGALGNGVGEPGELPIPQEVAGITTATAVSVSGEGAACARLASSAVDCWGLNNEGQLGDGTEIGPEHCTPVPAPCSTTPVQVRGITNAVAVSAGYEHACALLSTGHVECWGSDMNGELGDGQIGEPSSTPVPVSGISTATSVASGSSDSCAVLTSGHVYCWGWNGEGELGDGSRLESPTPVEVSGITDATAVSAGDHDVCALLANGEISCWGVNGSGQIGDGSIGEDVLTPAPVSGITSGEAVSVGGTHACAQVGVNGVECWGQNGDGELGNGGTQKESATPVPVDAIP